MGAFGITLGVLCTYERAKWGQKAKMLKQIWFFGQFLTIAGQEFLNISEKLTFLENMGALGVTLGV